MSYLMAALQTKEARDALYNGLETLFSTCNLTRALNVALISAQANGALPMARLGLLLDVLRAITRT
jgi:hypothetical protein